MANYHDIDIQSLAVEMINGNINSKNEIIEHYTKYIDKIIYNNFSTFDCDEEELKKEMLKILYRATENYKNINNEYFSHYVTRKLIQCCSNKLRQLKNKEIYKNREIQKLATKMFNGDTQSLNKIIEFYSYHIRLLAREKYNCSTFDEDDIVQIGLIGLLKAIKIYKENNITIHFSTYANKYINQEIVGEIKKQNKFFHPEYIGLNNNYNKKDFIDFIETTELNDLILELSDTKKKILYLYFWKNYTFKEIGNQLGFTEANAHLHYKECIENIKQKLLCEKTKQKKL